MDIKLKEILKDTDEKSVENLKIFLDNYKGDITSLFAGRTGGNRTVLGVLFKNSDTCQIINPVLQKKYILLRIYNENFKDADLNSVLKGCGMDIRFTTNLESVSKLIISLYKLNRVDKLPSSNIDNIISNFPNMKLVTKFSPNNIALLKFFKELDVSKNQYFDATKIRNKHFNLYEAIKSSIFPNITTGQEFADDKSYATPNIAFRSTTPTTPPLPTYSASAETNTERERREILAKMLSNAKAKAAERRGGTRRARRRVRKTRRSRF